MISTNKLNELSGHEVYEIFMLRQQVFMLEQNCLYQDIDLMDQHSWHIRYLTADHELAGYLRIIPPLENQNLAIGRVAVNKKKRRRGIAQELMQTAIELCQQQFPDQRIRLSGQTYLIDFYSRFGFSPVGPEYIEDDIPHQDMIL